MTENINIREARPEELGIVENLVKEAYREFQFFVPESGWEKWMVNINEALQDPGALVLVAEREGSIEGAVTFYPDASQAHQGHFPASAGAIRMLAVRPTSRKFGYGVRLTQACLDRARELDIKTIFLYTGTFMQTAQHLYEKLGFRRVPEFDGESGPIAYRLDL